MILSTGFLIEGISERGYIFGNVVCKLGGTFTEMSYTISVWSLVGANFERYIAICQPMQRLARTSRKAALGCTGIWLAAFAVCSPLLDAYEVRREDCRLDCSHR